MLTISVPISFSNVVLNSINDATINIITAGSEVILFSVSAIFHFEFDCLKKEKKEVALSYSYFKVIDSVCSTKVKVLVSVLYIQDIRTISLSLVITYICYSAVNSVQVSCWVVV